MESVFQMPHSEDEEKERVEALSLGRCSGEGEEGANRGQGGEFHRQHEQQSCRMVKGRKGTSNGSCPFFHN